MKTISHREYLTRIAWLDDQWNCPDRSDNYLMLIAAEVRRVFNKKASEVKLEHFKLKFRHEKPKAPADRDQITKLAKARHMAMLGGAKVVRVVKKHGNDRT